MKKKLTLNETWDLCLKMWEWVAKEAVKDDAEDADSLKAEWLLLNHPRKRIVHECFLCEYNAHREKPSDGDCKYCPARIAFPSLPPYWCEREASYHWLWEPRAFYRKLVELNKERLAKKK